MAFRFDDSGLRRRRLVRLDTTVRPADANWHVWLETSARFAERRIRLSFSILVARRFRNVDVGIPDNRSFTRVLELGISFTTLRIQGIVEALARSVGWASFSSSESRVVCVVILSVRDNRSDRGNTDGNTKGRHIEMMRVGYGLETHMWCEVSSEPMLT